MKINFAALLITVVALDACSGGASSTPSSPIIPSVAPAAQATPQPLGKAGVVRSTMATKSVTTLKDARETQGGYGGTPAFTGDVVLYDAPIAGYTEVDIALTEVDAITANGAIVVMQKYATPNVVNLLSLQTSALPIGGSLPGGQYAGLQLVGSVSKSSAVTSGGQHLGVVVFGSVGDTFTLPVGTKFGSTDGSSQSIAVDFNVAESVAFNAIGTGLTQTLQLKPVLVANVTSGNVSGTAVNWRNQPVSNATIMLVDQNWNVVNTTLTASDGTFNLHAIPNGTYQSFVFNAYENAAGSVFIASNYDGWWGSAYYGPQVTVSSKDTSLGSVRD